MCVEYMPLTQAARLARIPERTLRALVAAGRIRAIRLSPRRTLVHLTDACDHRLGVSKLRSLTTCR